MRLFKTIIAGLCLASAISCTQTADKTCCEQKNGTIETIMARRSIRNYKQVPVGRDTLDKIMECGINAPSAINNQSWEVRVVDDPAVFEALKKDIIAANPDANPQGVVGTFRDAPVMVFIANYTKFDTSHFDCGLLAENIMLSAWSMGVGSVCLGSPVNFVKNSPAAMERLGFSEDFELLMCIGLGYANESPDAKPRDWNKVKFVD